MKARQTLAAVSALAILGTGLLSACSDDKKKELTASEKARLCVTLTTDALSLTQNFNLAAFAHTPTPAELKAIDTQMASLRAQLKNLTSAQRAKMSAFLDASASARAAMASSKSIDAASVSLAEQAFAATCS